MALSVSPTRSVAGREVPIPGVWEFDTGHTEVAFEGRHLAISRIRGNFQRFSGRLTVAEVPEESAVELDIEAGSVSSGYEVRDDHLRSEDWFDVIRHPLIKYRSTGLTHLWGANWEAAGLLTVKGITNPISLEIEFGGAEVDPWDNLKLGFTGRTEVARSEWALDWNAPLGTGGLTVSRKVVLTASVEAVLRR